jgi:hypothetical protein
MCFKKGVTVYSCISFVFIVRRKIISLLEDILSLFLLRRLSRQMSSLLSLVHKPGPRPLLCNLLLFEGKCHECYLYQLFVTLGGRSQSTEAKSKVSDWGIKSTLA